MTIIDRPTESPPLFVGRPNAELFGALARVVAEIDPINPSGRHQKGYAYLSESDIIGAVRGALSKHGLTAPCPVEEEAEVHIVGESNRGAPKTRTLLRTTYLLGHESGGYLLLRTASESIDYDDNGIAKAQTGAYRQILRRLSLLQAETDPDASPSPAEPSSSQRALATRRRPGQKDGPAPQHPRGETVSATEGGAAPRESSNGATSLGPGKDTRLARVVHELEDLLAASSIPRSGWDRCVSEIDADLTYQALEEAVTAGSKTLKPGVVRVLLGALKERLPALEEEREKDSFSFDNPLLNIPF